MQKIKTLEDLKQVILLMEIEKVNCQLKVTHELEKTCEKLSPANLLKRQLNKWIGGSDLSKSIIQAGVTALAGYVAKQFSHVDESHPVKKIVSVFMQFGSEESLTNDKE